jgi:nicotinamide-nucleotide adenylyltransferase
MMEIFASELLAQLKGEGEGEGEGEGVGVDIAVTKHPYFVDKSKSIASSGEYGEVEQVHLIGFDTLTRLLDTKYYPPTRALSSVNQFLQKHRLLVTYRVDDKWGTREEQDECVRGIGEGSLDGVGGRREWVEEGRVRMVEGAREVVSSTRVREACKRGDREALKGLVTEGVAEWVLGEGLYLEDD